MNDPQYFILHLPQNIQDLINEYNVEHRVLYIKVMKELKTYFTCYLCNNISIEGLRYPIEHDISIIYCSTVCRNIRGWIGIGRTATPFKVVTPVSL